MPARLSPQGKFHPGPVLRKGYTFCQQAVFGIRFVRIGGHQGFNRPGRRRITFQRKTVEAVKAANRMLNDLAALRGVRFDPVKMREIRPVFRVFPHAHRMAAIDIICGPSAGKRIGRGNQCRAREFKEIPSSGIHPVKCHSDHSRFPCSVGRPVGSSSGKAMTGKITPPPLSGRGVLRTYFSAVSAIIWTSRWGNGMEMPTLSKRSFTALVVSNLIPQ